MITLYHQEVVIVEFFDDDIVVGCEQIGLCDGDCEAFGGCLGCDTCDNCDS